MNTNRLPHLALIAALTLGSVAAFAQADDGAHAQKRQAELQKRFAAADTNGDGRLTKDEAKAKMPMVYKHFDEIDTAHVGSVSLSDIEAFASARRAARQPGS